jgi:hypothetical protein
MDTISQRTQTSQSTQTTEVANQVLRQRLYVSVRRLVVVVRRLVVVGRGQSWIPGLGVNETLETLELGCVFMCDDYADLWCGAFRFSVPTRLSNP